MKVADVCVFRSRFDLRLDYGPSGRHVFFEVVRALPCFLWVACPSREARSSVVFMSPLFSGRQSAAKPDCTLEVAGERKIATRCTSMCFQRSLPVVRVPFFKQSVSLLLRRGPQCVV